MSPANAALERLTRVPGVRGSLLISATDGLVVAEHGFSRSFEVMTAAALGSAIVASTEELARIMGAPRFGVLVHGGSRQSCRLSAFGTPRGRWIGLVVFGTVNLFDRPLKVVMYFDGSVNGLTVGAPVSYRGVRLGTSARANSSATSSAGVENVNRPHMPRV